MVADIFLGISLIIFATIIGSFGALFLKFASRHVHRNNIKVLFQPMLYLGIFLYGISALIFVFALKFGDLSALYPVVALSYVWISLLSIKFLKEKMNDIKWFGILLILIGVILIGLGA
tara:strand:- start:789 stop:1142 length:354 start_codon:yes stop_codon:yes gene_type:complete